MKRLSTLGKIVFGGGAVIILLVGSIGMYRLMNPSKFANKTDQEVIQTMQKVYPQIYNLTAKDSMTKKVNQLYDQKLVTELYKKTASNNGWSVLKKRFRVTKEWSNAFQIQSMNFQEISGIERANVTLKRVIHFLQNNKTVSASQTVYFDFWNESGNWEVNGSKVLNSKLI